MESLIILCGWFFLVMLIVVLFLSNICGTKHQHIHCFYSLLLLDLHERNVGFLQIFVCLLSLVKTFESVVTFLNKVLKLLCLKNINLFGEEKTWIDEFRNRLSHIKLICKSILNMCSQWLNLNWKHQIHG